MKPCITILKVALRSSCNKWTTFVSKKTANLANQLPWNMPSFLAGFYDNLQQRLNSHDFDDENNICLDGIPIQSLQQHLRQDVSANETDNHDLFGMSLLFAAPKKKVSRRRKRRKHLRYFPDPINWYRCARCGEPKRPHRICTEHLEICAMRPQEYKEYLARKKANEGESNQDGNSESSSPS